MAFRTEEHSPLHLKRPGPAPRLAHADPQLTIDELRAQNLELLFRLAKCRCGETAPETEDPFDA